MSFRILNSFWLSFLPYLLSIWSSRVALALSLARIFPAKHQARVWSFILVAFLIISFIGTVLVNALSCNYPSWLLIFYEGTDCAIVKGGFPLPPVLTISDSIVSDVLLVGLPLAFFWGVKLPQTERRLILAVFCGSILTLIVAICFGFLFINNKVHLGEDEVLILIGLWNIEAAVCLFASNLPVVSTRLYQKLRRRRTIHRDLSRQQHAERTQDFSPEPCTCAAVADHHPSLGQLTLTEISTISSPPQSRDE
ncbi:hypothetical protein GALMADRAFT_256089 [Galerina marginata CBS 339.88]|uniref:Rhodopsin domain-containing protein n=1 Tax=Galerina marginata (strain CBS 339.88) TaxID=685588 RepID=A0A067SE88_GALM3|nr:hypothetical protein GALMADRAFT_256089 [Galerina marginata CBS 339.88]